MKGIDVIDTNGMKVIVPQAILKLVDAIRVIYKTEAFALLLVGEWDDGTYRVGTDYCIPRQSVGPTFVDFTDEIPYNRYNTIVLSYPLTDRFSKHDRISVAPKFACALHHHGSEITECIMSLSPWNGVVLVNTGVSIEDQGGAGEPNYDRGLVDNVDVATYPRGFKLSALSTDGSADET